MIKMDVTGVVGNDAKDHGEVYVEEGGRYRLYLRGEGGLGMSSRYQPTGQFYDLNVIPDSGLVLTMKEEKIKAEELKRSQR